MRKTALSIIDYAIKASLPYANTKKLISSLCKSDKSYCVISIGKASVPMAQAAADVLGGRIKRGLAVTKYNHTGSFSSPYFEVIEASHPISDENSILAAEKAMDIARNLTCDDTCIVLLSGGGSALFEKSIIPAGIYNDITEKLLSRGADISEINAVRRRLSAVKGGKFAGLIYPARVITIALSDVLTNDKKVIASGITVKDDTGDEFIENTVKKYLYDIDSSVTDLLYKKEDIKINDGGYYFAGDINILCDSAAEKAEALGYTPVVMSRCVTGEATEAAEKMISSIPVKKGKYCCIWGGETTVKLKGSGKGGRNQEMALYAAIKLKDRENILFASCGSDGTDGPTDAAGGIADGDTYRKMTEKNISPEYELRCNNSNYALSSADSLIVTGPTGTNVNDLTLILTDFQ